MKWYIGQEIVCVDDSNLFTGKWVQTSLKRNEVYVIRALRLSPCSCKRVLISVGHSSESEKMGCAKCGHIESSDESERWYSETRFRPLDELVDISELTEMLAEPQLEKVTGF